MNGVVNTDPQTEEAALETDIILPPGTDIAETHPDLVGVVEEDENEESSSYWDASSMAPLNAVSAAAIARLRAYKPPPFPLWDRLHLSRRAAVLLLLFADRRGDLRVVITMRAASLRSFSGHAAFPGGKADTTDETPYQIARREAWEEIGLPMDDTKIPSPFRIEHLCYLPMNLARTELIVRPCVAFLHVTQPPVPIDSTIATPPPNKPTATKVEDNLIPRLDAKEVAAVFSAPFHNFLLATDEIPQKKGKWYEGNWIHWHAHPWRVHYFGVPITDQRVVKPIGAEKKKDDELAENGRYKVWGMTARILVDAATIAYGKAPEFEHNSHFGDEEIILELDRMGQLGPKVRSGQAADAAAAAAAAVDVKRATDEVKTTSDEASKM
ncbi:coenzyme a diphosphatase [Echria macrotheca]|uniref:Coenzyme a diphosphatase n=1 Tax=Echria macrotheca TaxID=438768 RepID=A0AAJ0BBB2_9PEZI|nr:coenzyme a diphosphatase [Echria macrotheca]